MYRDRLWTMRQYAGFATPEDTNDRYRYLIEHGSTGLSMAFDLPTQLGRDSDDPLCAGEVGRTGVPIDTIEDMRICFDEIPLDEVSTSMTINAPAAILLLLYELVGEEQGVPSEKLRGTVQNDVLKEYVARGNYIYPPEPTMRLTTDIFEYCHENVPKWNTISISGYHIREKGCSAVQEVAFTLSNAIAYVEAALERGLESTSSRRGSRSSSTATTTSSRRSPSSVPCGGCGRGSSASGSARTERSQMIRFHTQTGGVTLQAQQPEVNIIRVALQGFAAVCGGTQSLHTNGFDEALALPTERSARIALRTQQVIAHESGAAETVDPFAGSYFVESLTDEIETRAWELIDKVAELGGSVEALEFIQREIEESALRYHERYKTGQDIIVGVNKYVTDTVDDVDILRVDPEAERRQIERLAKFKANRDQAAVEAGSRRCARSPGARATCCCPIRARARRERARSGRSVVRCGMCLGSTRAGPFSSARRSSVVARRSGVGRVVVAGRDRAEGVRRGGRTPRHGIEGQADPGQVRARALGARGRPCADAVVDGRPRRRRAGPGRGDRARAGARSSPGARAARPGRPHRARARRERLRDRGADHRPALLADPGQAIAALEGLLDELGSPGRRPFGAA